MPLNCREDFVASSPICVSVTYNAELVLDKIVGSLAVIIGIELVDDESSVVAKIFFIFINYYLFDGILYHMLL